MYTVVNEVGAPRRMHAIHTIQALEDVGFDRRQAEGNGTTTEKATTRPSSGLVTKDDLKHAFGQLQQSIAALRSTMQQEIAAVRAELRRQIGALAWKAAAVMLALGAFIVAAFKRIP